MLKYLFTLFLITCNCCYLYSREINPPDIARIKDRGVFIVCQYKGEQVPFFMRDAKNNLVGLDVDIARGFAASLGVKLRIQLVDSYNGIVDGVVKGQCDAGISKLSLTLPRAQKVLYTQPYVTMPMVLLINRVELQKMSGDGNISLENVIKQYNPIIYVADSSSYEVFIKELFPQAKIKKYDNWIEEAVVPVFKGDAFAAFTDEFETIEALSAIPDASLKMISISLKDKHDPIYMITAWDSYNLCELLKRYIEAKNIRYTTQLANKKYQAEYNEHLNDIRNNWATLIDNKNIRQAVK